METRRLSPTSLWIETPLSPQTPRLVWHAMAQCGLRNGKINCYADVHFSPMWSQPHLVEGRTPPGLFRDNARLQVRLSEDDGGTRLDFDAAPLPGEFDFGGVARFKGRLVPRIEGILRELPSNWKEDAVTVAPLASATDFSTRPPSSEAEQEFLLPLRPPALPLKERALSWARGLAWVVAFLVGSRLQILGPIFLALAGWLLWNGRKTKKVDWISLLFFAGFGLLQCWQLLRSWF